MAKDKKVNTKEKKEEKEEKPEHPPCPTCKEVWEGGAIFCDMCGYQESDEHNPLHPLPLLHSGVADGAGLLSVEEVEGLKQVISDLKSGVPIYLVTLNTPDDQTPGGIAYTLYNDWAVRADNADLGVLIYYDPSRKRVEIALGKTLGARADLRALGQTAREYAIAIREGSIVEGFGRAISKIYGSAGVSIQRDDE